MRDPARPQRILQLTATSDLGGAERMVLHLVGGLDRERFMPYLCSTVGSGELIDLARPACAAVEHLRFTSPLDPAAALRLGRFIRHHEIDLVQIHGLRAEAVGRPVVRAAGAKAVVSTIHSVDPWRRRVHSFMDRATLPWVTHHVAVCQAALDAALARGEVREGRFEVIPIGIPAPSPASSDQIAAMRQRLGIAEDAFPVIGMLANLRDMKGHGDLIAAAAILKRSFPKMRIICAGSDTSNGTVPAAARAAAVDDVMLFPGFLQDTATFLATLDIFTLPSHWEGLPVSIIEAMHAARPIVATNVGGIPELLTDDQTALLVPPRDPSRLAAALARLAEDAPLRDKLGAAAHRRALEEFHVTTMLARYQNLYARLLAHNTAS